MKGIKTLFSVAILSTALFSCERDGSGKCEETNISTTSRASHNAGEMCTKCHTQGRDGRGCFYISGSVFQNDSRTISNAVLVLFNNVKPEINSKNQYVGEGEIFRLPIDKTGNFYSTEFKESIGKYAAIIFKKNNKLDTLLMSNMEIDSYTSCNSCHYGKKTINL